MDRLTVEDCEQIAKDGFLAKNIANKNIMGLTAHIAQQLLDTMRENDENCRLLGMAAETELALMAKNERWRKAITLAWHSYCDSTGSTEQAREHASNMMKLWTLVGMPDHPSKDSDNGKL